MSARVLLAGGAAVVVALTGCSDDAPPPGPPQLRYGELADVQVGSTAAERVPVRATVLAVEQSSADVLRDGGLEELDLGGRVPFFVRVSYVNSTGRSFSGALEQQFRPRQSDGAYATRLDVVSSDRAFTPCEDAPPPASFDAVGGTADACLVVLAAAGAGITSVEWTFPDRTTEAVWRPA